MWSDWYWTVFVVAMRRDVAAVAVARDVVAGRVNPDKITERTFARNLHEPDMEDVDMFWRTSAEQRTSNFLLWQSA